MRRRIDLFGFIDLVALDGKPGLLGIQATSTGNAPSRVTKILDDCTEAAIDWLAAGNRIVVWGFALRRYKLKSGKFGKAKRWKLKEYVIVLVDGKLERRDPEPDDDLD